MSMYRFNRMGHDQCVATTLREHNDLKDSARHIQLNRSTSNVEDKAHTLGSTPQRCAGLKPAIWDPNQINSAAKTVHGFARQPLYKVLHWTNQCRANLMLSLLVGLFHQTSNESLDHFLDLGKGVIRNSNSQCREDAAVQSLALNLQVLNSELLHLAARACTQLRHGSLLHQAWQVLLRCR